MAAQRTDSHLWRHQSRTPAIQPAPSVEVAEIAPSRRSSATISGTAKMPRPTMTSWNPSCRYQLPKSMRGDPCAGASPIAPTASPSPAASRPFSRLRPASTPTIDSPSTVSMSSSGNPKASTTGRAATMKKVRSAAPSSPPNSDEAKAAARARAACPARASGNPSSTVAWEADEPGIPISTEAKVSEVGITATSPTIMARPDTGSIP